MKQGLLYLWWALVTIWFAKMISYFVNNYRTGGSILAKPRKDY